MSIAKTFRMTPQGAQKMEGWHSWRHRDREAQDEARETYLSSRDRTARQRAANFRAEARAKRTDAFQLALLDGRPGSSRREGRRLAVSS